jgi:hypothetical protein
MRTVSLATLRTFIKVQKNDRKVHPYDGESDGLGCILAHYCRSQKIEFTHCGFSCVHLYNAKTCESKTVLKIDSGETLQNLFKVAIPDRVVTYGKLKKLMF